MACQSSDKFETRAIHAGQSPDPTTGAIMTPIYQTSTYTQKSPGEFIENYDYARSANPTRTALEANLASLENAAHGLCFSSGCAATSACVQMLKSGDEVLLSDDVYGGTFRIFDSVFKQLGILCHVVDMQDLNAIEKSANEKTKLVWCETPSNPLLKILPLEKITRIFKGRETVVAVDNTFATPYLQNPIDFGADIVCHSATKYLGGHSDIVGGCLLVNDEALALKLRHIQNAVGAIPSPLDCFLLLRSIKTLPVRMDRHCDNAEKIVSILREKKQVRRLFYPFLTDHPFSDVAKNQMKRGGGMISLELDTDLNGAKRFLESMQVFSLAESLGGVESLIEHPAIMTHATIPKAQREKLGISDGFIRLSVGIEHVDDLLADLEKAFTTL